MFTTIYYRQPNVALELNLCSFRLQTSTFVEQPQHVNVLCQPFTETMTHKLVWN